MWIFNRLIEHYSLSSVVKELEDYYKISDNKKLSESIISFVEEMTNEQILIPAKSQDCCERKIPSDLSIPLPETFIPPQLSKYTDMQELLLLDPIHDVSSETGWPKAKDA